MARHRKIEDGLLRSARNDGAGKPAHTSAFPRRESPESCGNFPPRNKMRAWGMPGAQCTRSLACKIKKHTSVVTTGSPDQPGIPARNGFNGFLRDLPGDRACLSPSLA